MTIAFEFMAVLRDLLVAIFDFATGRRRRRYETSIFIEAPRDRVWAVVRSKDLMMGRYVPMRLVTETIPGRRDLERARLIVGDRNIAMMLRVIDERPEEALLLELLAEGSDPTFILGDDDRIGYALFERDGGTVLYLSRELTRNKPKAALAAPIGLRSGARRYRNCVLELAAVPKSDLAAAMTKPPDPAKPGASDFGLSTNGLLLGAVAFASFSYLWGVEQAAIIAAIIILHELGHAAAMILVGIPVKGIYLVPFFGGAAIAGAPYRSESQIGFVALMGPAFSLVPTFALALAARDSGSASLVQAAQLSAFINLFNLIPIIPLDGGLVLKSALVSVNRTFAQAVAMIGALAGLYGAWMLKDAILGVFVLLGLLMARQIKTSPVKETMAWPSVILMLAAFAATIVCYIALISFAGEGKIAR